MEHLYSPSRSFKASKICIITNFSKNIHFHKFNLETKGELAMPSYSHKSPCWLAAKSPLGSCISFTVPSTVQLKTFNRFQRFMPKIKHIFAHFKKNAQRSLPIFISDLPETFILIYFFNYIASVNMVYIYTGVPEKKIL